MNKFFTLLAAAGLAMSANATVLWEGEFVMDGSAEFNECFCEGTDWASKVAPALAKATDKSKLVFTYSEVSTDAENPGQIELVVKVGPSWTWTDLVAWKDIPGKAYTYTLDELTGDYTVLEVMQERGFIVKGKNATLAKVELLGEGEEGEGGGDTPVQPGENIALWEGEFVMDGSAEFNGCFCEGADWASKVAPALAKATDKSSLIFTYANVSSDPANPGQIELVVKVGPSWTWTDVVNWENISGTTYTYKLDELAGDYTVLEVIQERGFIVKGKNATLVKVELALDGATNPVDPVEGSVLWEGETVMGAWAGILEYKNIPENTQWKAALMSSIDAGDKLLFHYTDVSTDPEAPGQIQLAAFTPDAAWAWTELVKYDNITGNTYTYDITGDPYGDFTDVEMLSERGFAVKGQNATLVKVELIKKGAGVENVTVDNAIDFDAPVEIYTIEGRRVMEMTPGHIYILRQGNKVTKLAR